MMRLSRQNQLEAIKELFQTLTRLQAKWWCRALLHDLRMGANMKTVNSCFKALNLKKIAKFEMQLCDKLDLYKNDKQLKKIKKL